MFSFGGSPKIGVPRRIRRGKFSVLVGGSVDLRSTSLNKLKCSIEVSSFILALEFDKIDNS